MNNAVEIIKALIKTRVAVVNFGFTRMDGATFEWQRHELMGMLICLKNVKSDDNFYCFNYYENHVEFGYYDNEGKWNVIEG